MVTVGKERGGGNLKATTLLTVQCMSKRWLAGFNCRVVSVDQHESVGFGVKL